ncbi:MAG: hypothetical protein WCI01_01740 [Chlorobiaceae bacterium]
MHDSTNTNSVYIYSVKDAIRKSIEQTSTSTLRKQWPEIAEAKAQGGDALFAMVLHDGSLRGKQAGYRTVGQSIGNGWQQTCNIGRGHCRGLSRMIAAGGAGTHAPCCADIHQNSTGCPMPF